MIGELLAEVRKDHGHTQQDLADLLHISISTVRSWENEKSSPSHEALVSICKLYQVSADYLLGLTRVDPIYVQRRRLENFSREELEELKDFEEFLLWRKNSRKKP
jgi:transcriptional regulator with XRE-family HTH domain